MTITTPNIKMKVKMSLLCFANQMGRKISKLSICESEYFLAIKVKGQNILKINKVRPSPMTSAIQIHVKRFTLLLIPEYKT